MFESPTRPTRAIIEENFDTMEADSRGKRNGPKTAQTVPGPNPTPNKEVGLMITIVSDATDSPEDELRKHAVSFLQLTHEQGEAFLRNRTYYVRLGRKYGLSNKTIGGILGITEARVRQIMAGV